MKTKKIHKWAGRYRIHKLLPKEGKQLHQEEEKNVVYKTHDETENNVG